jgi:pheromone shutdown-related protein TraB
MNRAKDPVPVSDERTDPGKNEIIIIGTAHVSTKSISEVTRKIEELRPDIVAVELCESRYRALTEEKDAEELQIKEILSGGKFYYFLVQFFLAYVQKKVGSEYGVKPGAEMLAAIDSARAVGARVALVDRDIGITIQRFWSGMGIFEKIKLIYSLIPALFGKGAEDIDIDSVTEDDVVSQLIAEFRKVSPRAAKALVDERDIYIARNLLNLPGKVVAVVGAGHREGITKYLNDPEKIPDLEELTVSRRKRLSLSKLTGATLILIVIVTFLMVLLGDTSSQNILMALGIWFVVNGVLSSLGVILARGHPISVLTAFMVAWLTSLNPLIAAGWFAGMAEAWKRNPTVDDLKKLSQAESSDELMKNRLFRVILVAALANVGSMAGTVIGVYLIWNRLGLSPSDLISTVL